MTDKNKISFPNSLLETRDKIDAIDAEIHQLLMRRADLVQNVQRAKEAAGPIVNAMHADREIEMFRRFTANHAGCLPLASLQRMFREMIATFSHLQCPFKVFVLKGEPLHRDTARYFYGTVIEIVECDEVASLVSRVQAPTSDIVLLPASAQALDEFAKITEQGCKIFARLPFWDNGKAYGLELPDMFVVGHAPLKTVGNDYTVFKANIGGKIVLQLLENAGFEIDSYYEINDYIYCVIKAFANLESDYWQRIKNILAQKDIVVDFLGIYGKV